MLQLYHRFRERLRVLIPYSVRRFVVRVLRSLHLYPFDRSFTSWQFSTHFDPSLAISKYDIICLPIIDWEFRHQRPQQIMLEFARRGHRIFYGRVNCSQAENLTLRPIHERVWEFQFPCRGYYFDLYRQALNDAEVNQLMLAIHQLRETAYITDAIVIAHFPNWWRLAIAMRRVYGWKVIYDCMEDHGGFSHIPGAATEQSEAMMACESDMVLAVSEKLVERMQLYNSNVRLSPNAADFLHFQSLSFSVELDRLPRPIIGYVGVITEWFDIDLIALLAKLEPSWSFVLVGDVFGTDVSFIQKIPNVHLLGERAYKELPALINSFDAALIPHKRVRRTEWAGSVKLYEYLSAGKPVICSRLAWLASLKDYVYFGDDLLSFDHAIKQALAENDQEKIDGRRAYAQENSWKQRVDDIKHNVGNLYPKASIIILAHNNLAFTQLCLQSVYSQTAYPNFEVVVVDNGSDDGTGEFLEQESCQRENLTIISNRENLGFACANNQGIQISRGQYVVLLNNDCIVTAGWLSGLIRHLGDSNVGAVGPVTNFSGNESRIEVAYHDLDDLPRFAWDYTSRHKGHIFEIDMLAMFCIAFRREVIERVGALDERFVIGMFEDDDYAIRLRNQGYRLICAEDVFVHHFGNATFNLYGNDKYQQVFDTNRKKFEEKWGRPWQSHLSRRDDARGLATRDSPRMI